MNDHEAVALQLGREPIAFRVAARCPAGLPSVIENERRLEMPTSFWVTCPTLQAAISRVEAAGGVRAAQEEVGAEVVDEIHTEHLTRYGTRVAGVGGPGGRVKCLHAFTALHLAGAIPNPVAEWTFARLKNPYADPARCPECVKRPEHFPDGKSAIRLRLIEERGNVCESCGLGRWLGEPVVLEMHRKSAGGRYTRDNVILLCPNCHSTTDTWRNKKQGGVAEQADAPDLKSGS